MYREKTRRTLRHLLSRNPRVKSQETIVRQKRETQKPIQQTKSQETEPVLDALQESLRKYPLKGTPFFAFTDDDEAWFKKHNYPFERVKTSS
jgi:hypothetical protein